MIVADTRAELRAAIGASGGADGSRVGLVATMGALHAGHAALLGVGRRESDVLVASIFVNPLQFGPGEDLDRYPRTFDADLEVCSSQGVDMVFAPNVEEVYPGGDPQVTVDPGPRADILEGASRPDHFRGVLTVVAKLFGLVQPDVAAFGEKDYQQLALIVQMTRDLSMPIEVIGAPTVREADGLAMSSRNRYLDPAERQMAVALSRALFAAREPPQLDRSRCSLLRRTSSIPSRVWSWTISPCATRRSTQTPELDLRGCSRLPGLARPG